MIDTGTYGAKRVSWRRANPRALLEELLSDHPKADQELIRAYCRESVRRAGEDYTDTIFDYWFDNNYRSIVCKPSSGEISRRRLRTKRQIAAITAQGKAALEKVVGEKAEALLLDTVLPSGKTLRDSTFGECRAVGGWLSRIGAEGGSRQIVGKHLTEQQVRKLQKAR